MRKAVLLIATVIAVPLAGKLSEQERIDHVLDRLTFGARPGDAEQVRKAGIRKWIALQLHPEQIQENPVLDGKVRKLGTLAMSPRELVQAYPPPRILRQPGLLDELRKMRDLSPEERRKHFASLPKEQQTEVKRILSSGPRQVIAGELAEGKLLRAIYSNRQLAEVLTDFWFNHFNIYLDKGPDRYLTATYERETIRPRILGKFQELVAATAESPAMLFYLDNWQSADPAFAARGKRVRGLNENYARELMELHTLGVDGGYTQKDVTEVARCFTGWTIREPRRGGGFEFNPRMHDRGEKSVLGHKIAAGGGKEDGLRVIDILVHHPSTARFISRKLAMRFVADSPPDSLVMKMAASFQKTGGDIRAVMETMLDSKEFWAESAYRAKMKSPFELVVSAVRTLNGEVTSARALAAEVARMGEPLYRKQEPTGYSDSSEEWLNSASLLARMNFATALAANEIRGVRVDTVAKAGLRIGSPEFQRR